MQEGTNKKKKKLNEKEIKKRRDQKEHYEIS
jgi:hypothetical protein